MEQKCVSEVGMVDSIDVLVVGAGPVGLTLAIALRRLSLRVRVVDKASGTNREPRADVIFPRAGEALGAIGVGETIRDRSYQMQGANFYADGRHMGSFKAGRFASEYPRAMTIEQHDIERLLAEELAELGVDVEWGTEVTDVRGFPDRVEVPMVLPNGVTEVADAAWVVGCDGNRSTVRRLIGIPFEGRRRENMQVIQGNVIPSWPLSDRPGHGYFFLTTRRTVLAFPTPSGGYRIFCVRDDPDPERTEAPTLDELRDLVAEVAHIPDLKLTLTDPIWLSRTRVADRVAARLRQGRVLLAGDAAHAWAPIGGHGMNVGMLGAHNLAWKLAAVHKGEAAEALLDSYEIEQRALALRVIRDMRMNIMEVLLPPLAHRARCAFLRATMSTEGVQRRTEWMMSDFGRHHRKSPLSWQPRGRRARRLRAGDRLPDVTVVPTAVRGDGGQVTFASNERPVGLHRLLRYDRWTLLLDAVHTDAETLRAVEDACSGTPVEIIAVATTDPEARRQLGRASEFTLVRPDGYVGLVAPLDRLGTLREYLDTYLHGGRGRSTGKGRSATPEGARRRDKRLLATDQRPPEPDANEKSVSINGVLE
jgi:2-polyprenyl-6-methoxyphenol hydroxylase-like FAD-dependent oxidoreductase